MTTLSQFTDGDFPDPTASGDRINVFERQDGYVFKRYFDTKSVFQRLRSYYNDDHCRFDIPRFAYPSVVAFLEDNGYRLVIVDDTENYVVAVKKYSAHPNRIRRRSVSSWSDTDYNYFLLKDRAAVDWAVMDGAVRVADNDLASNPP